MPNYPKYRPSGNTLIDSDEVLEAYLGSEIQEGIEGNPRTSEERNKDNNSNVQRDPPTTTTQTLNHTSKMTPSGRKNGFLPIAMPRPDPPDEMDTMSRSSTRFTLPPHIEVRSSSDQADDLVTELSDDTYTTEFVSEGLADGEKRVTKSSIRKYHGLLQEKRNKLVAAKSPRQLHIVAEESESSSITSEREIEHIDITYLEKHGAPVDPIDVTGVEDMHETIDLVETENQPSRVIDMTSYEQQGYQPSSVISEAKRDLALLEAKVKVMINKPINKPIGQEPPSDDAAAPISTIGPPTPRIRSPQANSSQTKSPQAKSPREKPPPESQADSKSTSEIQSTSHPTPKSPASSSSATKKPFTPSLLKKSLKGTSPLSTGPREAAAGFFASSPQAISLRKLSTKGDKNARLLLKETVSAEGSVIIDTTTIDEDDLAAMQLLNSDTKDGEPKTVFSFVSTRSAPEARQPPQHEEDPPQHEEEPPQHEEESHFKEFVMFTAGCIQSFATTVNSKVQEKIKEIPAIDLLSDKDMDGMLGALEKGMSERNCIVPTEDEDREMLSNFLEDHITQPVCGMDQPTWGTSTDNGVDELIESAKKMGFSSCGVSMPTTQKKSKLMDEATPKEFVIPVNYERRRRHSMTKE
jgi:hypothetical protein